METEALYSDFCFHQTQVFMYQNGQDKRRFFSLKYSASIRIWHWLTFLLIAGSIITVLFAENLFEEEHEGPPPTEQREHAESEEGDRPFNANLSPEEKAGRMYQHKIWEVHKYIGFCICILFLWRIITEVRKNKEGRWISRINKAMRIPVTSSDERSEKLHYLLSKWGYVLFYILLLCTATTGLILAFEHTDALKPFQEPAREIHETLQYFMYLYILAHLAGVIYAEMKQQKGIVSAMINGGE